jgi:nicotinamidase-related amidase
MPDIQETWSQLTLKASQVMICDLQEQIVTRSKTTKPDALSQSAQVLCQMAQLFKLPLTFSVVPENKNAPKLIASLQAFASERNQFLRATASPFIDPATREHLASLRRPTLIIAGFATEVVVLHAALDALREGYGVIVAVDACGGMSDRTESAALAQIRDNGGVVSSVVSIATALSPDFTKPQGQQMFQIVQTLRLA